jgi:hypothetical protein
MNTEIEIKDLVQVSKKRAKKLSEEGKKVFVTSSNCDVFSNSSNLCDLAKFREGWDFEECVEAYRYFHCNNEVGNSVAYYLNKRDV